MKWLGNLTEDQVVYFRFSTHKADGTPITLAGTPAISVYKDDGDTQSTAGITLAVDDDSVTGMHTVKIDTSADAFYAVAHDYSVVITTGTVDSVSVVGTVLATFSIENRFIESTVTSIAANAINAAAIADDAITAAKLNTGAITADAFAANAITNAAVADDVDVNVKTITAGAITAAAIATDAIDADAVAADAITAIWAKAMSDLAAVPGATASVLDAINLLFELARNKLTQTADTQTLYKDDGSTALATSTVSDDATTFTRTEFTTVV
jgi:hypothetical protein